MAQSLGLKIKGLFTNPNTFSEAPEGSLSQADNTVLDRDSIIATRRGQKQYGNPVSVTDTIDGLFEYQDTIITHTTGDKLYYDSAGDGTVWTQYSGTYEQPDSSTAGDRVHAFQSNKNFYFTTSNGIYKLSAINATPIQAGAPAGLGGSGATTGASGFMTNNTNVAYRIVWGYRDANENLILGAPSDRIIVSNNSGGTRNVNLTFLIPEGIDTTWFYQVYRSGESASLSDSPNDELQQVLEANPTAGQITAGSITVLDATPNDLRQAFIYTSPSQQGIENANYRPPFAKDATVYKNYAFYANTRSVHRFNLSLISAGAPSGIQVGDTITFTNLTGPVSFTLTGAAAQNAALGEFKVSTGGSPAENIEATCRSIVEVVNIYASNTFLAAYYTSGFDDLPGQMMFEKLTLDPNKFYVTSSRTTCWAAIIPTSGQTQTNESDNDVLPNRVYYSKFQQPEAVPLYRYFDIGSADEPILRVVALRDGILILKTDGVFRISGESESSFRLSLLDNTVKILAPNSTAVLSNQVFFYSTQGVVAASDSGVQVISRPIENVLLTLSSDQFPNFPEQTFAVGYESDRKYMLWTVSSDSDTAATQAFIYNTFTNTWTRWTRRATCGGIKTADDKLYLGSPVVTAVGSSVLQERKTFTSRDYADEQYAVTVVSVSGMVLNVASTTNLEVGMTIEQGTGIFGIITSIVSPTQLTLDRLASFLPGAATAYKPIYVAVTTNQIDADNPGILKQFRDCSFLFANADFTTATATFYSDFTLTPLSTPIRSKKFGGWGQFAWNTLPWGGFGTGQERVRTLVPQQAQRVNWLTVKLSVAQAFSSVSLQGVSFTYEPMSERQRG